MPKGFDSERYEASTPIAVGRDRSVRNNARAFLEGNTVFGPNDARALTSYGHANRSTPPRLIRIIALIRIPISDVPACSVRIQRKRNGDRLRATGSSSYTVRAAVTDGVKDGESPRELSSRSLPRSAYNISNIFMRYKKAASVTRTPTNNATYPSCACDSPSVDLSRRPIGSHDVARRI